MEPRRFNYKKSVISYCCFGTGPTPVICFHGYGEDASFFEFLAKYPGNQFTLYCLDLPFHGKTEWKGELTFTETDLLQAIQEMLSENDQKPATNKQQLVLLGFSLGGRIALSLYQAIPERVERLILLAPDGLKVNFWYWLSTQTWLGNKLFAFTMKHPGWFFGFIKLLNKVKMINASIFKFVTYYVNDEKARHLLFNRWTTLRKLKPNLTRIKNEIHNNNTPVRLLYGKHDRIILSSVGERFKAGIEEQCVIKIIPSGHQVLHEKHTEEILSALLH